MPQSEAREWWADVQHVRESIERRRADAARSPRGTDTGRFARAIEPPEPTSDDDGLAARAGRFDREPRPRHGERSVDADAPSSRRHRDAEPPASRGRGQRPEAERQRARSRRPADDRTDQPAGRRRRAAETTMMPPPPGRRTVQITGRTVAAPAVPRLVELERRRPARRPVERIGARPDRIAMWAVLLGFFLILVAATSSRAATPASAPAVATHSTAARTDIRAATTHVVARHATRAAPARIAAR
jgi:hypothetical protein